MNLAPQQGFGDPDFLISVYVEKRPPMAEYQALDSIRPLQTGEIEAINSACGNGWRKLFNVYAKLLHALPQEYKLPGAARQTWQAYRDGTLLQPKSKVALIFGGPESPLADNRIYILAGRTHAKAWLKQRTDIQMQWLDDEFALATNANLFVCPYFDYRQLSNIKITRLINLIHNSPTRENAL